MKPEEQARQLIDQLLTDAGWQVQSYSELNLGAGLGVAVREYPLKTGFADYMLFIKRKAAGVIEAKAVGTTLSGVADQSAKYQAGLPDVLKRYHEILPFAYESTGVETMFRDSRDPDYRSRRVFAFHRPETLREWLDEEDTLRSRLRSMPPLLTTGLRDCQIEAITNLETSLAASRPRALIQMATGSGKTYMAVSAVYRLLKFARARRVLFLVDRGNLGKQTLREFQQYVTPDDGRKFTELYNVQRLTSNKLDRVSKVCITTIQRLYSMLKGEEEFDEANEEESLFDQGAQAGEPRTVRYNPQFPLEDFDFIITDECHRSIYNLWRQVLEYYDAFLIGLTATPSIQTFGFFNQNLVMEYRHDRAVADGVNVPFDVYRIQTRITEQGSQVEAGYYVDRRDRLTRKLRWEQLDGDLTYRSRQLDRDVVAKDQIRTVIRTFRDRLFTEIFPGREWVPKTLIFAKDDSHAEDIVEVVREEFGKGNEFCKKITYRTTGEKPEDLIASFRNSPYPRIAVTVDMIATGTDIKPLECLLFMRDVRATGFFEQMKGRGTRTISVTEYQAVTPDSDGKTHFVIVDAVGVCESDKSDSRPLERKRSMPFDKLMLAIAQGNREPDVLTSLAGRLARLNHRLDEGERQQVEAAAGKPLTQVISSLLGATDPDQQIARAQAQFQTEAPTDGEIERATEDLVDEACEPFDSPELRNLLNGLRSQKEQTIDTVSQDEVLFAGYDSAAAERARSLIESFRQFIEQHKDEITALQILYNQPYGQRQFTYDQIRQLAEAIARPPYHFTPEGLWHAYEQLEAAKVRGKPEKILTNLISLVRYAIGETDVLEPFSEVVNQRFATWLTQQEQAGRSFTREQREWLEMIRDHIATSLNIEADDFEYTPFDGRGGQLKAVQLFGSDLPQILQELNEVLAA
ncbi:DEAD/DEAH box helicase family protein [Leptolyngbya sp. PL-A3]|uniref:type I restriction endonuclease subunit R n=1 Tax=Leptolyngbya sp. PL-A3 TaxID=2933911 RepID=UPI0032967C4A